MGTRAGFNPIRGRGPLYDVHFRKSACLKKTGGGKAPLFWHMGRVGTEKSLLFFSLLLTCFSGVFLVERRGRRERNFFPKPHGGPRGERHAFFPPFFFLCSFNFFFCFFMFKIKQNGRFCVGIGGRYSHFSTGAPSVGKPQCFFFVTQWSRGNIWDGREKKKGAFWGLLAFFSVSSFLLL